MTEMARTIIFLGLFLVIVGIALHFSERIPGLGRLPGDFFVKKGNLIFYFPFAACILISILLSLILHLWSRR